MPPIGGETVDDPFFALVEAADVGDAEEQKRSSASGAGRRNREYWRTQRIVLQLLLVRENSTSFHSPFLFFSFGCRRLRGFLLLSFYYCKKKPAVSNC